MSCVPEAQERWVTAPQRTLSDPVWVALVLQFNLDPVAYADPSWLPPWAMGASEEVRRALSQDLLKQHELDQHHDWGMEDPVARIFCIDTPSLSLLATAVGVASHRHELRQVVSKTQLASLHSGLGNAMEALWLPTLEPIAFAPPASLVWGRLDAATLRAAMACEGFRQLLRLADPSQAARQAVSGRMNLCAPRHLQQERLPALNERAANQLVGALINDMLPRWAPSWTWLF